jgi:DNA-binding NarL/FixJ family response regulator
MNNSIKVLVISNVPFFLDGIKAFLITKYINAVFKNYEGIIENINLYSPEIVVLDDSQADVINFTSLISDIIKNNPGIKIIVYTENNHSACLRKLIEVGIKALLYIKGEKELLFEALVQVEKGEIHFDDYFNKVVLAQAQDEVIQKENLIGLLSKREKEILKLLPTGLRNKEMAEKLCVSSSTIGRHKANIIKKLELKSVAELTVFALNNLKQE